MEVWNISQYSPIMFILQYSGLVTWTLSPSLLYIEKARTRCLGRSDSSLLKHIFLNCFNALVAHLTSLSRFSSFHLAMLTDVKTPSICVSVLLQEQGVVSLVRLWTQLGDVDLLTDAVKPGVFECHVPLRSRLHSRDPLGNLLSLLLATTSSSSSSEEEVVLGLGRLLFSFDDPGLRCERA